MSSDEALAKMQKQEDHDDAVEFRDLRIIDDIIRSFDVEWPIKRLLENAASGAFDVAVAVDYHFNYVKYTGTIDTACKGLVGFDAAGQPVFRRQLTLRLCHDGFRYHNRATQMYKMLPNYKHGGSGWGALKREVVHSKMAFLRSLCSQLGVGFTHSVLYNKNLKRIDISVFNLQRQCALKFTFEEGNPAGFSQEDVLEWEEGMAY